MEYLQVRELQSTIDKHHLQALHPIHLCEQLGVLGSTRRRTGSTMRSTVHKMDQDSQTGHTFCSEGAGIRLFCHHLPDFLHLLKNSLYTGATHVDRGRHIGYERVYSTPNCTLTPSRRDFVTLCSYVPSFLRNRGHLLARSTIRLHELYAALAQQFSKTRARPSAVWRAFMQARCAHLLLRQYMRLHSLLLSLIHI